MPQRFYFDLARGDDVLVDEVGVEARDLAEAVEQIGVAIEELRGAGQLDASEAEWDLVIRDQNGEVVTRVPLRSVN